MYHRNERPETTFRTLEIDSGNFRLKIGDSVTPQTIVGRHFRTGELVVANCWGRIAGVSANPVNHALLVAIYGSDEVRRGQVPGYEEAFNGFQS